MVRGKVTARTDRKLVLEVVVGLRCYHIRPAIKECGGGVFQVDDGRQERIIWQYIGHRHRSQGSDKDSITREGE